MRRKIAYIGGCVECPHYEPESFSGFKVRMPICRKKRGRNILPDDEIGRFPKWCPLDDKG